MAMFCCIAYRPLEGRATQPGLIQPLVFLLLAGGWRVLARYGLLQMAGAGQERPRDSY